MNKAPALHNHSLPSSQNFVASFQRPSARKLIQSNLKLPNNHHASIKNSKATSSKRHRILSAPVSWKRYQDMKSAYWPLSKNGSFQHKFQIINVFSRRRRIISAHWYPKKHQLPKQSKETIFGFELLWHYYLLTIVTIVSFSCDYWLIRWLLRKNMTTTSIWVPFV